MCASVGYMRVCGMCTINTWWMRCVCIYGVALHVVCIHMVYVVCIVCSSWVQVWDLHIYFVPPI